MAQGVRKPAARPDDLCLSLGPTEWKERTYTGGGEERERERENTKYIIIMSLIKKTHFQRCY